MRLSGLGSLAMGMLLLDRAEANAEDGATRCVAKALRSACGPWLTGCDRKSLSARLQRDGWDAIDDALFTKTGSWGTASVSLPHLLDEDPLRTCEIRMSTNEQPWTTVAAANRRSRLDRRHLSRRRASSRASTSSSSRKRRA